LRSFRLLIILLPILIPACGTMDIKAVNPEDPNALESNETMVFGRIIFTAHSKDGGEVSFPPMFPGLVQVETGKRASAAMLCKKRIELQPPLMRETTTYDVSQKPWFADKNGTFFWILPAGTYKIDALSWLSMIAPLSDIKFYAEPKKPPECGFVVRPDVTFSVSGEKGALYLGTLIVDMDVDVTKRVIVVKNVNRIEIRDDYDETCTLLKDRFPSFTRASEKNLMGHLPDHPLSVTNGRCPSSSGAFMRGVAEFILKALGGVRLQ
jgi:hypothetical protein